MKDVEETSVMTDLRDSALFSGVSTSDLELIADLVEAIDVDEEAYVFREGDPADALYIVQQGSVSVFRDTIGLPMQTLAHLRRGEFFGEMGMLCGVERSASVRAIEPTRVMRIDRDKLSQLVERHPILQRRLQATAARRHSANIASALELGRRREVRIRFHHQVTLELENSRSWDATLENLSLGGLCLRGAPEDWEVEEDVEFGLGLKVGMLPLAGRIAWRRADLPQGSSLGLAFNKTSSNHDKLIQMAIHLLLETSPLST